MEVADQKINRRLIRWKSVRGPRAIASLAIGTVGGIGLSPFAPGTMGTLVGIPLVYLTQDWSFLTRVCFWLALLALGTWAAKVFDETMQAADHQSIVVDEVIGYGITAWTLIPPQPQPLGLFVAFVVFRFFDILKPPPVRQADTFSKNLLKKNPGSRLGAWVQGFGVMLDDVLAGFLGLATMIFIQWMGWL